MDNGLTKNQVEALREIRDGVHYAGDRATRFFKYERDGLVALGLIYMANAWTLTEKGRAALEGK